MAANPERLGAEIGLIAILHTWGQNLTLHPHIHCVIPGGGLSSDQGHWVSCHRRFFLPVKALKRVFRGKFIAGLKRLYRRKKLGHAGPAAVFSERKQFAKLVGRLRRQDWVGAHGDRAYRYVHFEAGATGTASISPRKRLG